jgi:amidohydrolase
MIGERIMEMRRQIQAIREEVIALRRDFHRHPELGLEEHRTSGKILAYLQTCGLETGRANRTGVVGLLRGSRPGPTLLLRADMDALPIAEENEVPYKSVNPGVMHACGHDAHCAMLLGAVKILSSVQDRLAGNIKFVFQPNEENVGALGMIEDGVLENPRVDACLGVHVWTPLASGSIGLTAGAVMAGMEHFDLAIKGKGGHTATPQSAIDPILTAAHVVQAAQVIQTREIDPLKEPTIIMFGKIGGGTASNVIPDSVQLSGTMRYLFAGAEDSEDNPKRRFERIVSHICAAHRAGYRLEFLYGHPTLVNHADMVELVRLAVTEMPDTRPKIESVVTLAGEDFSEFTARVPGAFYFLGAGSEEKQAHFPHHHPRFNLDEDILTAGVELHVRTALRYLNDYPYKERR